MMIYFCSTMVVVFESLVSISAVLLPFARRVGTRMVFAHWVFVTCPEYDR